jgi:tol-pal system protein YbgF
LRPLDSIKRWLILGFAMLLLGCATFEDVQILDDDIRRLQSQVNAIQKEEEGIKKELSTFQWDQKGSEQDVGTLRTDVNNQMKRLQADLLLRIDNLQSETRALSTSIGEYKDLLKRPSKEFDRMKEDVSLRTKTLEEKAKTSEEKNRALEEQAKVLGERDKGIEDRLKRLEEKMAELIAIIGKLREAEKRPPAKEVPSEVKGVSTGAGDLYKDAYETFQKGNLEGARRKFEAFLKQYPNTELSDNAQFWIGETYYLKKDFEKAILEYEKAIAKYPEGDKVPAALFKQALAFLELKDKTNARNLLKRVIERYPNTEQAEMAKKRLEMIK